MAEEFLQGGVLGEQLAREVLRVEIQPQTIHLFLLLKETGCLQETIEGIFLLQRFLLDVQRIFQVFCLHPSSHVFAKESLDVLFLCVAIQSPSRLDYDVTCVIQLR